MTPPGTFSLDGDDATARRFGIVAGVLNHGQIVRGTVECGAIIERAKEAAAVVRNGVLNGVDFGGRDDVARNVGREGRHGQLP
jgi:hypothetical protein